MIGSWPLGHETALIVVSYSVVAGEVTIKEVVVGSAVVVVVMADSTIAGTAAPGVPSEDSEDSGMSAALNLDCGPKEDSISAVLAVSQRMLKNNNMFKSNTPIVDSVFLFEFQIQSTRT